ncbi:HypC/HybG/HupF family hydrogenase formation chaperone [Hydrogenimonas urashimensis]|uniref:HypC/HybG/HupF family hydrogenase formation chaperone n=1 Tax=Hydrogenimonas urashimensis TaxID=2740515 RepID=UPI001914F763|nr:HypC/HybG/HupF family hydrogenase formation chaperone [Hydrogenimonas urashimensis]
MCLSIPSKVVKIDKEKATAVVDTMGVQREVGIDFIENEVKIGDYVLIHIGFAMNIISEEEALASIETYKEILALMDEEQKRQAILDGNNCSG